MPSDPQIASTPDLATLIGTLDRLARTMSVSKAPALWSLEDIASWMSMSESTVSRRVISHPSFPPAVAPGARLGSNAQKRWFADEVVEWARRHRSSVATRGRTRAERHV